MEQNGNSKWQIRAAALAIFLLGFLAGALSLNYYRLRENRQVAASPRSRFDQMLDQMNLNSDQRAQVEKILSDSRAEIDEARKQIEPQMTGIRTRTDDRLKAVLTPAQWQQFQQMTAEMRNRRRPRAQ